MYMVKYKIICFKIFLNKYFVKLIGRYMMKL